MKQLARFVECRSCRSTYHPDVLDGPDRLHIQDVLTKTLRRAVPAVLDRDDLSPRDRREAVIVLQRYANVPYGYRDLELDLTDAGASPLEDDLRHLAASLNDEGRETALGAAVQLATVGGPPSDQGVEAIRRIAGALSLPCDRVRRSIDRQLQRVAIAS